MKIADSQSIKTGEKDMILSIMKKMDPQVLAAIATQDLAPDSLEFVSGDMTIVDSRIVYKMNFKVTVDLTVMFDREGNLVRPDEDEEDQRTEPEEAVEDMAADGSDDEDPIERVEAREPDETDADPEEPSDHAAPQGEETPDLPVSEEEESLEAILQRNKNFWSEKTAGVE